MKNQRLVSALASAVTLWCYTATSASAAESASIKSVSIANAPTPLGIDAATPTFSWVIAADQRDQKQTAYQIRVASSPEKLEKPDLWDSGKVTEDQSQFVPYKGAPLRSRARYFWSVRIWDAQGQPSAWSKPAWWEMGLLKNTDWQQAKWIGRNGSVPLPPDLIKWQIPAITAQLKPGDAQGQSFTTDHAIVSVSAEVPTFTTTNSSFTLSLYANGPGGKLLARQRIENHPDNHWATLKLDKPLPAGKYYFEQSDVSGKVGWYTFPDCKYAYGKAYVNKKEIQGDRKTKWEISGTRERDGLTSQLRREFDAKKTVKSARLYITALGTYRAEINGQPAGADYLAPGWTDYDKRVQYQTYDVTNLVRTGRNAIAVDLGPGWYAGNIGSLGPNQYGQLPYLRAQLELLYTDGSSEQIATDGSWKSALGPMISTDLIMGDEYDARLETPGWKLPNYDDKDWKPVLVGPATKAAMVAQADPPIRVEREIKPVKVTQTKAGTYIYDMGQNMVGVVRMSTQGNAGQVLTLRYAEVLNPDGTLYTDNLRTAKATDQYTMSGKGVENYEPAFTFHGFRYVEVSGATSQPDIVGRVLTTDMPSTMSFSTNVPMLNQLQHNILWSQRGDFLSVPMDTPARDERLGWTGDIGAFAGTAAYNMRTLSFLGKWLTDLRDTQSPAGAFADVAPTIQGIGTANAGWGDAGVSVPWTLYQRYGDPRILEDNFAAMERWVAYLAKDSKDYLRPDTGYGDWLNVDDETPKDLIATAFFADSAHTLARAARVLKKDPRRYDELFENIRRAFARAYVLPNGRLKADTQTAYVLALGMDLVPADLRKPAADRLVELIKNKNWHLSTGFLGTPRLLPALSETGHTDVAYRLLLQTTFPSWGYQIGKGATTMWERWDGIRPDGSFQSKTMNSFNHYAYGSVGEWMYQNVAGIRAAAPGFQRFVVKPVAGGDVHAVDARYESGYGPITVRWNDTGGKSELDVGVPVNTSAEIWVANTGGKVQGDGARFVRNEPGFAVYEAGSGNYRFTVR
ncbi:glycoside hydrolase family 78 protein [Paraburkholderia sp. D15]|uniref:alpha-L-rhamnosidase n=1 Tax=Paraburkholderia sp. D15 TaxID=2880218 RepID=UPI00247962F3|nr:alpha-L-rhamnosidase [Paraburkholderia sp. D15]WGS50629.1 glycoside hydrolase family 78 protein [Paraburkholderia sp. D15]